MISQHSDHGTAGAPEPGAGFLLRIPALAAVTALLAGLRGFWWPGGRAFAAVGQEPGLPAGWDDPGPLNDDSWETVCPVVRNPRVRQGP
jgi:hypothetical protein